MPPNAPQQQNNAKGQAPQQPPRVIEGFDPNAFANGLAKEASQMVPPEFQAADKKYIVDLVAKFCFLCGDAISKDPKYNFNAAQATLITQFIGEWTFHKSIDLIKGGIPPELRDGVLQKIAFTVFEVGKLAISKNAPREQMIRIVEAQVNNVYRQALEELKNKGRINENLANNAINQSNIDAMAKEQYEQEKAQAALGEDLSDTKIMKLASLALLIKKFPQDKVKGILTKLNQTEAEVLLQYIKMPNLEKKLDKGYAMRFLEEIKGVLPEPKNISIDRVYAKLFKIVKSNDKNKISNIIDNERPAIKQFVLSPYTKDRIKIPARVGNVICKYLEEKLSE